MGNFNPLSALHQLNSLDAQKGQLFMTEKKKHTQNTSPYNYALGCLFFPTPRFPVQFNHTRLRCQGIHSQFLTCIVSQFLHCN